MNVQEKIFPMSEADRLCANSALNLENRPYSSVSMIGNSDPKRAKRYYHMIAHGGSSAEDFATTILLHNAIPPDQMSNTFDLLRSIEATQNPQWVAGAVQIRSSQRNEVGVKAYFRPTCICGMGFRSDAMHLAREAGRFGGDTAWIYKELMRRDAIARIHYVAISLRPNLEIETYHDRGGSNNFSTVDAARVIEDITKSRPMSEKVGRIAMTGYLHGLPCNHLSVDMWPRPKAEQTWDTTVVLSPRANKIMLREVQLKSTASLALLDGAMFKDPVLEDLCLYADMEPSVLAVLVSGDSSHKHHLAFEEVDPRFADIL